MIAQMKGYIGKYMANNNKRQVGLVIMASGLGKRFGGNKLMANLGDKPVIKWIIDTTDGLFDKRIVVTRSCDVKALCETLNIECIYHEMPNRNDTVRIGLDAIKSDIDICFFAPGDQPLITGRSITKLINEAVNNEGKIVRSYYDKTVGAPIGFPKRVFDELMSLPEGKGGGVIAQKYSDDVISVPVEHEYEIMDIDTVEDLENMNMRIV